MVSVTTGIEKTLSSVLQPSWTKGKSLSRETQGPLKFFSIQEILEEYNESNTKMNLVLFDDALEHLTRVHRIIRLDSGHALLVGVGGSGKQSLARLAAFTAGYEVRHRPSRMEVGDASSYSR